MMKETSEEGISFILKGKDTHVGIRRMRAAGIKTLSLSGSFKGLGLQVDILLIMHAQEDMNTLPRIRIGMNQIVRKIKDVMELLLINEVEEVGQQMSKQSLCRHCQHNLRYPLKENPTENQPKPV